MVTVRQARIVVFIFALFAVERSAFAADAPRPQSPSTSQPTRPDGVVELATGRSTTQRTATADPRKVKASARSTTNSRASAVTRFPTILGIGY